MKYELVGFCFYLRVLAAQEEVVLYELVFGVHRVRYIIVELGVFDSGLQIIDYTI